MGHETCCATTLHSTLGRRRPFFLIILPLLSEFVGEIGVGRGGAARFVVASSPIYTAQSAVLFCYYKTKWEITNFKFKSTLLRRALTSYELKQTR